ncbi:MAG: hypothetical protein PVI92_14520 [Chromatiales bacterium]|jgi:hypothetical protein
MGRHYCNLLKERMMNPGMLSCLIGIADLSVIPGEAASSHFTQQILFAGSLDSGMRRNNGK